MLTKPSGKIRAIFVGFLVLPSCMQDKADVRMDSDHGRMLFVEKCAQCHGRDGTGGGPASLGLGHPPPDLTTLAQQNHGQYPRDYVMSVIDGLERSDNPSSAMPEFGAEDMGPIVRVEEEHYSVSVPADLFALANYLEDIQK